MDLDLADPFYLASIASEELIVLSLVQHVRVKGNKNALFVFQVLFVVFN